MLLTRLRRLAHAPESGFAGVDGPVGGAEYAPADAAPAEVEAEVVEGGPALRAISVGAPCPSGFVSFLDGIQRQRVALFDGPVPIVFAYAAAVVRARKDGRMRTLSAEDALRTRYQEERQAVFFPFRYVDPARLEAAGIPREQMRDTNPLDQPALPLFPPALYARATDEVNHWREDLERLLAKRWCQAGHEGFLLVDGSITMAPEVAACERAVGVVKSHRTRYFDADDMRTLLGLGAGERSSVFRPASRSRTAVYSWYLRLRSPVGRDVFWGLVRLEAAASESTLERVDEISRWMLAEAAPLSLPDPRWDRMVYPIRDCETYLRARVPGEG